MAEALLLLFNDAISYFYMPLVGLVVNIVVVDGVVVQHHLLLNTERYLLLGRKNLRYHFVDLQTLQNPLIGLVITHSQEPIWNVRIRRREFRWR